VGLVEVDTGSIRTGRVNQAEGDRRVASAHTTTYQCKYGTDSLNTLVPIVNKQANRLPRRTARRGRAVPITSTPASKRLIIELELVRTCASSSCTCSLKFRHRHAQLLPPLRARASTRAAGDGGGGTSTRSLGAKHEMALFHGKRPALKSANRGPAAVLSARRPRMELHFILHTRGIEVEVVRCSDPRRHLLRSPAAGLVISVRDRTRAGGGVTRSREPILPARRHRCPLASL